MRFREGMNGAGLRRNPPALWLLPLHGTAGASEKTHFSPAAFPTAILENISGYYNSGLKTPKGSPLFYFAFCTGQHFLPRAGCGSCKVGQNHQMPSRLTATAPPVPRGASAEPRAPLHRSPPAAGLCRATSPHRCRSAFIREGFGGLLQRLASAVHQTQHSEDKQQPTSLCCRPSRAQCSSLCPPSLAQAAKDTSPEKLADHRILEWFVSEGTLKII